MSASWFPTVTGVESAFEICVDDPGYGVIMLFTVGDALGLGGWEITLAGGQLGAWLSELTERALCTTGAYESRLALEKRWSQARVGDVPAWVTTDVARDLLPAFQAAVLLAAAGTEKNEQLFVDPAYEPPAVICARCDVGSPYSDSDATSAWCEKYGHSPFGWDGRSWEAAIQARELKVSSWEFQRRMDAIGVRA